MRRAATEWRVAARLARREVRRRPGRATLVLLLVGLPVAGLTLFAIGARSTTPSPEEQRAWELGQADDDVGVWITDTGEPSDEATFVSVVQEAYPPGSRFLFYEDADDAITKADGHLEVVVVTNRPIDDPLLEGMLPFEEGRAPRSTDEVVISRRAAELSGADIGSTVDLLLLGRKKVTGIVANPTNMHGYPLVVTTDALDGHDPVRRALVDAPPGFVGPRPVGRPGISLESHVTNGGLQDASSELRDRQGGVYLVGGIVLAVVAVITTAAFAVAARRQLRMLGLLSASGVPPSGLRRAVLLQGTTSGAVGGALGVAVGLALARVLYPYFDDVSAEYVPSFDVHVVDLLGPFALGVVAATAAAWFPARTVARIPVLAALAGRKPQGRLPVWIPVSGLVSVVLGVAGLAEYNRRTPVDWEWFAVASGLAVLFGGVALAPWVVSHTEPLARRLRGGGRVAARDLGRQRLRSGAVVAAVMAPTGLLVIATVGSATNDARNRASYEDTTQYEVQDNQVGFTPPGLATGQHGPADQLEKLRAIIPDAVEVEIDVVLPTEPVVGIPSAKLRFVDRTTGQTHLSNEDSGTRHLIVNERADLEATDIPDEVLAAFDAGKIVVFKALPAGVDVDLDGLPQQITREDIAVFDDLAVPDGAGIALVSRATAQAWGAPTLYYGSLFQTPRPLTERQRSRILALTEECGGLRTTDCRDEQIRRSLLTPDDQGEQTWIVNIRYDADFGVPVLTKYGYPGALLVFTLLVVAVALALTAAESRDERALLDAVGAPPSVRRSITAWQAGLLPAMGILLAVPGGLAVGYATIPGDGYGEYTGVAIAVPWLQIAVVSLAIPVVSAGIAWLGASVGGRRRRDLSTLALAGD